MAKMKRRRSVNTTPVKPTPVRLSKAEADRLREVTLRRQLFDGQQYTRRGNPSRVLWSGQAGVATIGLLILLCAGVALSEHAFRFRPRVDTVGNYIDNRFSCRSARDAAPVGVGAVLVVDGIVNRDEQLNPHDQPILAVQPAVFMRQFVDGDEEFNGPTLAKRAAQFGTRRPTITTMRLGAGSDSDKLDGRGASVENVPPNVQEGRPIFLWRDLFVNVRSAVDQLYAWGVEQSELAGLRGGAVHGSGSGFPCFSQRISHVVSLDDRDNSERDRYQRNHDIRKTARDLQPPIKRRLGVLVVCVAVWLGCFWRFWRLLNTGSGASCLRARLLAYTGVGFLLCGLLLFFLTGVRSTWGWWL